MVEANRTLWKLMRSRKSELSMRFGCFADNKRTSLRLILKPDLKRPPYVTQIAQNFDGSSATVDSAEYVKMVREALTSLTAISWVKVQDLNTARWNN